MSSLITSYKSIVMRDGPLHYFGLGEASGTTAVDSMGNANGTLHGGVTLGQTGLLKADPTTCMLFDGTSGYIDFSPSGLSTGASSWSLEAWVKTPSSMPAAGAIILLYGTFTNNNLATVGYDNSTNKFDLSQGNINVEPSSTTVSTSTTYHVVGTYDGTNMRLYINGTLAAGPTALTPNITLTIARIGNDGTGEFWKGNIGHAALYTKTLSAAQILHHYQVGNGGQIMHTRRSIGRIE